ncbi:hypothetical protein BVC80_1755g8 [Macleaya cordata]|uniref:Nucleoporin protein Ndc1-Nup n=1 Tax=Macleaya cordata TaxID=56857 RepID=A0A200QHS6_MACCD|nr:hypothetical protein BVC80_1755g8 [Macleaya cordata]
MGFRVSDYPGFNRVRDRFRRFKMGFPSAVGQALKLSTVNFLCSALLVILLPSLILIPGEMWRFVVEHFIFYVGSSAVALCWEISYLLCQVMYAKRYIFAPRSKAANPSPPLFRALEESSPRSLRQYLAYLDLCMVCENNADVWRRDFFFESTGSYERVVAASLRPLEQLTSELADGLKGSPSMDRTDKKIFRKFRSPTDTWMDKKLQEAFKDFQLCVWCVRAVAALTECSRKNPRYSYVVDNSACSTTIVPSLLSCLLAVEACMWKKINLQQSPHFIPRRRDDLGNKSGGYLHAKAYAMADVLRTSVYSILSAYHSTETTRMDREIVDLYWPRRPQDGALRDPLYGTHYMLQEKLGLFLEHQA